MVAGFAAPIALAAIAFGEYAGAILPGIDKTIIAVSIIVLLSLVHLTDVRFGCHFQNLFTVGKILLIVSFIILGFSVTNPQDITLPSHERLGISVQPAFAISSFMSFTPIPGGTRRPTSPVRFSGRREICPCFILGRPSWPSVA
jgi:APA family basic amino acid/polyamine antiporter